MSEPAIPLLKLSSLLIRPRVSSYSENQPAAGYGYNKSGDGLNTIKLTTQHCLETGQPIAYAEQPGNIPDVVSVVNASRQPGVLGMEKPMLVMDAGFFSENNLSFLAHSHVKFLIAGKDRGILDPAGA